MPILTTSVQLIDCLRKSRLVADARLSALLGDLGDVTGREPRDLAQSLIRRGALTAWQASQLLSGKWRGFHIGGGKYRLMDLLGAGGMGKVYLCEHARMQRLVALKILPTDRLGDPECLERFEREARAAGMLDHPNLVRAFDLDRDGDLHFLVMEYVDGSSLHRVVAKTGPLSPARACHYIHQAAEGLQYAHATAGLVHRDVKPGNILVDRAGTVKVLDMGLSRFLREAEGTITHRHDRNSILGTADYLAPEQGDNSADVDIRADIYSLGATFYFLLTGRAAFEGGSVAQKIHRHQTQSPAPLRSLRPEIPRELEAIVSRMMAKKPEHRYQEPAEVAAALAPWCGEPIDPPAESELPQLCPATAALFPAGPRSASGSAISVVHRSAQSVRGRKNKPARARRRGNRWIAVMAGSTVALAAGIWWTTAPIAQRPTPPLNVRSGPATNFATGDLPSGDILPPAADGTIYVAGDPRRKAAAGSRRDLVESFGEALALAAPGGRIVVLDGTIEGQFRVDGARVPGLTIEGRSDNGRPIVWRPGAGHAADLPLLTLSHAGAARIHGFEFDGAGRIDSLMRIDGESSDLQIEQTLFRGAKSDGLILCDVSAPADKPVALSHLRLATNGPASAIAIRGSAVSLPPAIRIRANRFEGPFAAAVSVESGADLDFTLNRLGTLQPAEDAGHAIIWRAASGRVRAASNTLAGYSSLLRVERLPPAGSVFALRSNLMLGGAGFALAVPDIDADQLARLFVAAAGNVARPEDANGGIAAVGKASVHFGTIEMNPDSPRFLRYRPTPENRALMTAGANGEPVGVPPD